MHLSRPVIPWMSRYRFIWLTAIQLSLTVSRFPLNELRKFYTSFRWTAPNYWPIYESLGNIISPDGVLTTPLISCFSVTSSSSIKHLAPSHNPIPTLRLTSHITQPLIFALPCRLIPQHPLHPHASRSCPRARVTGETAQREHCYVLNHDLVADFSWFSLDVTVAVNFHLARLA